LVRGVRGVGRPAEALEDLADPAQPGAAPVGDRPVDGDAVDPGFRRGVGPPAVPCLEGLEEGVLGAVLGSLGVGQDRAEGAVHSRVGGAVEAVEVLARAGSVWGLRHERYNGSGYT